MLHIVNIPSIISLLQHKQQISGKQRGNGKTGNLHSYQIAECENHMKPICTVGIHLRFGINYYLI